MYVYMNVTSKQIKSSMLMKIRLINTRAIKTVLLQQTTRFTFKIIILIILIILNITGDDLYRNPISEQET